jgi:integrase
VPLKLVKRPTSPYWIIRGTLRGVRVEESTGTSEKWAAEETRAKREAEILRESIYGRVATFDFAQASLSFLEEGGSRRFIGPVLDHFGTTPLRHIGQEAVDNAASKLYPQASNATRNRQVYTPVSAILQHAARKGWCPRPVFSRPKMSKVAMRWLKADEAERLIEACSPHLQPLVIFLLYTGARAGEALWLDWSNVDLKRRHVTFPKTKNGDPRGVPLHSRVVAALEALPGREGPVFRTPYGAPYARPAPDDDSDTSAGSRIKRAFAGACRRAAIHDFTPHGCRHTWATWHYQANRNLTALQSLGGWKTLSMVMRYAHTNVDEHAHTIDRLPGGNLGELIETKGKTSA